MTEIEIASDYGEDTEIFAYVYGSRIIIRIIDDKTLKVTLDKHSAKRLADWLIKVSQ